jgi:hypothetical protein
MKLQYNIYLGGLKGGDSSDELGANGKMDLWEVRLEDVDWIYVAFGRGQ